MSLGATLRQARDARKLTCEQLARTTRIPVRLIVAMERDDWNEVPGGIFARGYLRAYGREVGLDGGALAAQYDAEQAPPPPVEEERAPAARPVVRVRFPIPSEATARWLTGWGMVALLLLAYVAGRWTTTGSQGTPQPPEPVAAVEPANAFGTQSAHPVGTSSPPAPGTPAPTTASGSDGGAGRTAPRRPADPSAPLVVEVAVTRPCWVTASADGERTIYRILQPGERVQARGRVLTLRVGDAGALRLSLDGEPARPLGASGEVVTIRITRENYRSLLPPRAGD